MTHQDDDTQATPNSEGDDTEGHGWRAPRTDDTPITAEGEDTEGHGWRPPRTEDAPHSGEGDDTEGYSFRRI